MERKKYQGLPEQPDFEAIAEASGRITDLVTKTPVVRKTLESRKIVFKQEYLQRTGSFKLRGAANAVLVLDQGVQAVVTASAGNHGLGVVQAASSRRIESIVFVSRDARRAKVEKMKALGATVRERGQDYDEAEEMAMEYSRQENLPFIHAFDDPAVIAGQGTVALEFFDQVEHIDTLLVPVGGGGLISGCALAAASLRPECKIYGIQPAASAPMLAALKENRVIETPIGKTTCDALAGRFVTERTMAFCRELVEDILEVSEGAILAALVLVEKLLGDRIEPSAVAGLAALLEHGEKISGIVGIILSGGNIGREDYDSLFGKV